MTFNLPPAIIRWISMLETTQHLQGRGLFVEHSPRGNTSYCALGILCLANGKPLLSPNPMLHGGGGNWRYAEEILGVDGARAVYFKNDNEELSFKQIAEWAAIYFSEHGPHIDARNKEQEHA